MLSDNAMLHSLQQFGLCTRLVDLAKQFNNLADAAYWRAAQPGCPPLIVSDISRGRTPREDEFEIHHGLAEMSATLDRRHNFACQLKLEMKQPFPMHGYYWTPAQPVPMMVPQQTTNSMMTEPEYELSEDEVSVPALKKKSRKKKWRGRKKKGKKKHEPQPPEYAETTTPHVQDNTEPASPPRPDIHQSSGTSFKAKTLQYASAANTNENSDHDDEHIGNSTRTPQSGPSLVLSSKPRKRGLIVDHCADMVEIKYGPRPLRDFHSHYGGTFRRVRTAGDGARQRRTWDEE